MAVSAKNKLIAVIGISFCFFIAELAVAFKTKSIALVADAFHYLNDLISYMVALAAIIISEKENSPDHLSFGWQRARLLGAFFNGVFLLAVSIFIFLQSIERFIDLEEIQNPMLVLILGCIGLGLNILSAVIVGHDHGDGDHGHSHGSHGHSHGEHDHAHGHSHDHDHAEAGVSAPIGMEPLRGHDDHKHVHKAAEDANNPNKKKSHSHHDAGMMGVLLHVIGDAINNIGVIIAALAIWKGKSHARFYADPAVSLAISIMIMLTAVPLTKYAGTILLQSSPTGLQVADVKHDLEKIDGIESVHELHIWRLDQQKSVASLHVVLRDGLDNFMEQAKTISECLHAYGIHSVTVQPETAPPSHRHSEDAGVHIARNQDSELPSTENPPATASGAVPADNSTANVATSGAAPRPCNSEASLRRRAACQVRCPAMSCEKLACCSDKDGR